MRRRDCPPLWPRPPIGKCPSCSRNADWRSAWPEYHSGVHRAPATNRDCSHKPFMGRRIQELALVRHSYLEELASPKDINKKNLFASLCGLVY